MTLAVDFSVHSPALSQVPQCHKVAFRGRHAVSQGPFTRQSRFLLHDLTVE